MDHEYWQNTFSLFYWLRFKFQCKNAYSHTILIKKIFHFLKVKWTIKMVATSEMIHKGHRKLYKTKMGHLTFKMTVCCLLKCFIKLLRLFQKTVLGSFIWIAKTFFFLPKKIFCISAKQTKQEQKPYTLRLKYRWRQSFVTNLFSTYSEKCPLYKT